MVSRLEKVFDRVIGILPPNIAEELSSRREVVIESLREGLDNVNLPPSPLTWRNGHGRVDRLPSPPNVGSSGLMQETHLLLRNPMKRLGNNKIQNLGSKDILLTMYTYNSYYTVLDYLCFLLAG
jgi:hypothetical protein